jgi:hypothetical protein
MALTRTVSDYKDSVRASSTGANINLAAAPNTLDGVSLVVNDRVLVKDQTPSSLNGIYRVTTLGTGSNGSWTRSSDFNDWREISAGAMVFVELGATNGNSFYFINGAEPNVTINTTAINFSNLYSVNGNVTSFPGNVNIAGTLNVVGNIISQSYETVTLTEYANSLTVTGNINLTNSGNINVGAGGNIYLGNTPVGRFYSGNTSPASPNLGDTWYQGNTDILYEYIQDANNNKYWLDLSSNPSSYGNLTVANTLTINGNLSAPVSSINITGGTAGYVLRTDGAGNLSWVAVSATAGGSNTYVQFNDAGSIGGATYLQYNKTTGNITSTSSTTSVSTTTGAFVIPSLGVSGNVNANAYYSNYYLYSNGNPITTPAGGSNTMVQFNNSGTFTGATYLQYNLTSGNLVSNSTTQSTSTTTGAIVTPSAGISGNVNANAFYSNYYLYSNGSTITTPAGGGNSMVQFNDGSNFSGATYLQYNKTSGNLVSNSTTTSTSKTTGAIVLGGGIGIGGNVFANAFYADYHLYANGNVLKSGSTFTTSNTAPSGAVIGDFWYKGNSDVLYEYVQDAASNKFWLDLSSTTNNFANLTATTATITNAAITNLTQTVVPSSNASINIGSASSGYFNAIYAVTFTGTSTTAKYADLAEMYHSDDYYAPGTVMIFGGDLDVTISTQSHDTRIAGVVSTNPAYLMNDNFEQDNWLPIALTGRVPCNVRGPVNKGTILVSSDQPGIACALDKSKYEIGCVIGKSMDIITDNSVRKIEIAVGRY